ncbi:pentapeptide repeat-containing protein [Rhizobium ruizarguesonis]|uniref:pentapeptide repeat-containing protein n=1 Tax=Rhizobium ruizarguesonis TaxID=2081791 RepID=UPI00247965F7|nr:pentapeptide repeat-containing protein [Rhizobium ruizarguesonis]
MPNPPRRNGNIRLPQECSHFVLFDGGIKREPQEHNQFDGSQMQGMHYKRADMSGANFDGVNLADAQFYGTR